MEVVDPLNHLNFIIYETDNAPEYLRCMCVLDTLQASQADSVVQFVMHKGGRSIVKQFLFNRNSDVTSIDRTVSHGCRPPISIFLISSSFQHYASRAIHFFPSTIRLLYVSPFGTVKHPVDKTHFKVNCCRRHNTSRFTQQFYYDVVTLKIGI